MPIDPVVFLESLGLPQILLWLLSFAIIHGILTQVKTPDSKMARGIISVVIAFFVILAAPIALVNLLAQMSGAMVLIILGILVIVVFLEVAGIQAKVADPSKPKKDKEGNITGFEEIEVSIFKRYAYLFTGIILIIAILIFVSAGGLQILGISAPALDISSPGTTTIFFFIVILLAILWMISNPE